MLREDGYVFDDGTIACLGAEHFLVTATTRQCGIGLAPHAEMRASGMAGAGCDIDRCQRPLGFAGDCRAECAQLLEALGPDFEISREAFPFAAVREGQLDGLPARVFSVSFSGELSYEINVPAGFAETLLAQVIERGAEWDVTLTGWKRWTCCGSKRGICRSELRSTAAAPQATWVWVEWSRRRRISWAGCCCSAPAAGRGPRAAGGAGAGGWVYTHSLCRPPE